MNQKSLEISHLSLYFLIKLMTNGQW